MKNKRLRGHCRTCGARVQHEKGSIKCRNDPDNLIGLCPNHHWELDNGVLSIDDVRNAGK